MRSFFLIILFFISTNTLLAQHSVRIRTELDSTRILVGDHLRMQIRLINAEGVSEPVSNLKPLDEAEAIEIIDTGKWDTLTVRGKRVLQQDIIFTSFDSGYHFIPQLPISYKMSGRSITQSTSQLAITVVPSLVEGGQETMRGNKEIIAEPLRFEDFLPFLLGLLALGLLGGLVYYILKKRQQKEVLLETEPEVILPPHQVAFAKLSELKSKNLWQTGKVKEYQSELTYIVREYLENRYNIQALESTSDEIIRDLKNNNASDITEAHRSQLREMFTMADLVKFAKAKPPEDANEKLMNYAENFVENTKKTVVESTTDEA